MALRKVWVRELLTRRPEFGQYDNLLTEVHKEDQRGYKNNLRITPDLFQECLGMACTATRWHVSSRSIHDEFTNSWRIVHDPFAKFCRDSNFKHFKILFPTWHAVTTSLRTLHASLRLVCALTVVPMRASESCKCQGIFIL